MGRRSTDRPPGTAEDAIASAPHPLRRAERPAGRRRRGRPEALPAAPDELAAPDGLAATAEALPAGPELEELR